MSKYASFSDVVESFERMDKKALEWFNFLLENQCPTYNTDSEDNKIIQYIRRRLGE